MLASRNIVFTPLARCLTSLCIISIFYLLLTGHDLVIQRRASFDRTRFCSGLNLENLYFLVFVFSMSVRKLLKSRKGPGKIFHLMLYIFITNVEL